MSFFKKKKEIKKEVCMWEWWWKRIREV